MGPWLVLVSPCFRENEVATCKIGSFLCSLDNLLQKNVIVFFFGNQISKWRSFEKRAIFDLLFTFFSYQGKVTKIPSAHISLTYTYFAHPLTFFAIPILKKIRIYQVRFLFGMSPGVDSYSRHFGTINNGEQNLSWNVYYWYVLKLMPNLQSFVNLGTLNDGGENSVKYRNRKKHRFLAAAILLFIGKIFITW